MQELIKQFIIQQQWLWLRLRHIWIKLIILSRREPSSEASTACQVSQSFCHSHVFLTKLCAVSWGMAERACISGCPHVSSLHVQVC